jgi:hypothetical protein
MGLEGENISSASVVGENSDEPQSSEGVAGETQTALLPSPEKQVWDHYQATVAGANRREFDSARRTCVRRALKVRTVEQCCEAINQLAASPFHNGQNEGGTKYLDIQYALGKKSESADARIDKWLERSGPSGSISSTGEAVLQTLPSDLRDIVQRRMRNVEQALLEGRALSPDRDWLAKLKRPITPVIEDGKLTGWVRAEA